jgi:hypothetical protein
MSGSNHEEFSAHVEATGGSDRSFGFVFAAFFALVALAPLRKHLGVRWWAVALALLFFLSGLFAPAALHSLNRVWIRFAALLAKITNPVITGVLFFVIFAPAALLIRLLGKDLLQRRLDPAAGTYWARRGPGPIEMRNPF